MEADINNWIEIQNTELRADKIFAIKYFDKDLKLSLLLDGSWISFTFESAEEYHSAVYDLQTSTGGCEC